MINTIKSGYIGNLVQCKFARANLKRTKCVQLKIDFFLKYTVKVFENK